VRNWVSSDEALDEPIEPYDDDDDVPQVSAGQSLYTSSTLFYL